MDPINDSLKMRESLADDLFPKVIGIAVMHAFNESAKSAITRADVVTILEAWNRNGSSFHPDANNGMLIDRALKEFKAMPPPKDGESE